MNVKDSEMIVKWSSLVSASFVDDCQQFNVALETLQELVEEGSGKSEDVMCRLNKKNLSVDNSASVLNRNYMICRIELVQRCCV